MRWGTTSRRRIVVFLAIGFLAAYLVNYVILSCYGGYYFSQTGEARYRTGLSISDIAIFQPRFCYWQGHYRSLDGDYISRGNNLGYFFSPLIYLDRRFVHKTKALFNEKGEWQFPHKDIEAGGW